MAEGQAPQGASVAAAQSVFVKAASSSKIDSNDIKSSDSVPNPASTNQVYASGCPVVGAAPPQAAGPNNSAMGGGGGCPVVGVNPGNQMAPSPNAPLPGQSKPLGTWRQDSSIPTGTEGDPSTSNPTWTYPSEQMFYNAMKKKGWSPSEDDMPAVVAIHNAVNERAWREIQHWEAVQGSAASCGGPRLVKFKGRPQDYSPKARLLNLLGYKLPFDRHDWVVDRCGTRVRYIIDFYNAAPHPEAPAALHLDVRPALDSPAALWERLAMQWRWVASGRWRRD